MIIRKLSVINFKNHSAQNFDFSSQLNCFVGNNGVGKTNILDALHYLSVAKSFLGNTDLNNIKLNQDFFALEAEIFDGEKDNILQIQQPKETKKKSRNLTSPDWREHPALFLGRCGRKAGT